MLAGTGPQPDQHRPESGASARADRAPDPFLPPSVGAELVSPRPQPPRRAVQRVLLGETHRSVDLVADLGDVARRLAAEKGVNLGAVKGTGPRGRIVKADVESAPKGGAAPAAGVGAAAPREHKTLEQLAFRPAPTTSCRSTTCAR